MGEAGFVVKVLKQSLFAGFTCIFALGGAFVGAITGAITGQTTETGFVRGAGIGTLAGAILAIELSESLLNGDSLSKIDIIGSLVNGKIFLEWTSAFETSYREISDIFDIDGTKGLSSNYINKLPQFKFSTTKNMDQFGENICSICLQDFSEDDSARRLPRCKHLFHLNCIDEWLVIQGSCPICREDVLC
ncbi:hypothetical protein AQUCO_00500074v1 [Aquilegia coerulea]|uniref:RING-type domain-containing protein n=2 Tax=Aquilegia coerulea TaxID=218851 RepID=A0A2G5EQ78_AQUCA|nr:hypothetical protein AQUCO_00500074v1 [Aquilegia coerulea]